MLSPRQVKATKKRISHDVFVNFVIFEREVCIEGSWRPRRGEEFVGEGLVSWNMGEKRKKEKRRKEKKRDKDIEFGSVYLKFIYRRIFRFFFGKKKLREGGKFSMN